MRKVITLVASVAFMGLFPIASCVRADDVKLEGSWKLVLLPYGEDEFLVFKTTQTGGKLSGEVVSAQQFLGSPTIEQIDVKGDRATIKFRLGVDSNMFRGTLVSDGADAGRVLGTLRFRDTNYPARIETTEQEAVGALGQGKVAAKLRDVSRDRDAKARRAKLDELLEEFGGQPSLSMVYGALLRGAADAEIEADQVRAYVEKWLDESTPYGNEWTNQCRIEALIALNGKKEFVDLALELAMAADNSLGPNAPTEDQANVVKLFIAAASLAKKADLTKSLEARSAKLEAKLDAEYHEKVPPFKPDTFAGRRDAEDDRVVLLELFTGAQCPPCVAADVGFDALLKTYQPTELVTLQYHLHIPGPDPLTNPSSMARAKYYAVNSTPSTFFNGKLTPQGGGGMAQAKDKYDQYRGLIDEALYGKKPASVDLKVTRDGDTIQIAAAATANPAPKEDAPKKNGTDDGKKAGDDAKEKAAQEEPQLRLRLLVTEESVRYVGGNRLRFHHHVVRAFPGGADGTPLTDGKCESEVSLNLADLRGEITDYLDDFAKTASFPNPLPPIEFNGLSVVALVQDDSDKSVLHAVTARLPDK